MNAILIAIAFVILVILIVKFYKGRIRIAAGVNVAAAAGAPPAAAAAGSNPRGPDIHNTGVTIGELKNLMTGAIDPNDYPNQCSDGSSELFCPYVTRNDKRINSLYKQYQTEGNPVNPFAGAFL